MSTMVDIDAVLSRMTLDEKLAQLGCVWCTALVADERLLDAPRRSAARARHRRDHAHRRDDRAATARTRRVHERDPALPRRAHAARDPGDRARGEHRRPLRPRRDAVPAGDRARVVVGSRSDRAHRHGDPRADGRDRRPPHARTRARRRPRSALGTGRGDLRRVGVPRRPGSASRTCAACRVDLAARDGVAATGKHFLGYALSEGGLNHAPVQIGPRELREVVAEPFRAAIAEAGLATVMNSYASVDGLPCGGSKAILDDLLRGELGFTGAVVADYSTTELLMSHHRIAGDQGRGGAGARSKPASTWSCRSSIATARRCASSSKPARSTSRSSTVRCAACSR